VIPGIEAMRIEGFRHIDLLRRREAPIGVDEKLGNASLHKLLSYRSTIRTTGAPSIGSSSPNTLKIETDVNAEIRQSSYPSDFYQGDRARQIRGN
jgi:hypothetical protein